MKSKRVSFSLFLVLFCMQVHIALGQERSIRGTVIDEVGQPLPGATVIIKGTSKGESTDFDGNFTISASPEDVLSVSYIGYSAKEISIGNQTELSVQLSPDAESLSEVVVIGYGTQSKKDLTGSVSSIDQEQIGRVPVLTLDQAMQGVAAGVDVRNNSSVPGGDIRVRIRGINSINGNNDPLYVIDGVIGGNLNTVDPSDIQSIDVLKDAAAASIYGARAANGVVIVTTRGGRQGKARVSFETWSGIDQPGNLFDMMDSREYMEYVNEANQLNNNPITYPDVDQVVGQVGDGTEWQDQIFKTGLNQKYYLAVDGGTETVSYMFSGGYQLQEGLIPTVKFERYNTRANIEVKVSDRVKFGSNISYVRTKRSTFQEDATTSFPDFRGPVGWSVSNPPILSPFNANGDLEPILNNPFATVATAPYNNGLYQLNSKRENLSDFLQMNFFGELKLSDPLSFKVTLGVQPTINDNRFFNPLLVPNEFQDQFRSASRSVNRSNQWLIEPTLTYNNIFKDRHNLTVLLGSSTQKTKFESLNAGSQNFPFDFVEWNNLQAGEQPTFNVATGLNETQYQGFFGRLNYDFDGRILLQINGRYDGASRFQTANKWAFFPSFSAGWRLSEENFMKSFSKVDDLKIRASFGTIGSQSTPPYATISQVPVGGTFDQYFFNGQLAPSYVPELANRDLIWETTRQTDIGLDLRLFNGKLGFTADYYKKVTEDLILNQAITIVNSAPRNHEPTIVRNVGSLQNTGIELALDYRAELNNDITWLTNLNFSHQANKILDLNLEEGQEFLEFGNNLVRNYHRIQPGLPFGNYSGYKTNGLFQTQEEVSISSQPNAVPGDIRYIDTNEDGVINEQDKTIVGNALPDFLAGWTNTFSFKGFELSFFLNGAFGHQIFNMGAQRFKYGLNTVEFNKFKEVANNRWTGPGTSNSIPRAGHNLINGTDGPNGTIDIVTEDASFVKLRNVTLAYNFPESLLKTIGISSARLYLKGQNLLVFTKYSGYDPEATNFRSAEILLPVETLYYPLVRNYSIGVNLGF